MTQAHTNQKPLGVQAATAATATPSTGAAKPSDKQDAKPSDKPSDKPDDKANAAPEDKKSRSARKVYVVLGEVHEFESVNKAEKFLNADGAPATYTVLRGNRIGTSKKVSLR